MGNLRGAANSYSRGQWLAEQASRLLPREEVRTVALTGYGRPEDRRRILSSGFQHSQKPVEPVTLARAIAALSQS
ncbi:MAG: hypothetical protein ABI837_21770 [Acidobacteriota bacterium]